MSSKQTPLCPGTIEQPVAPKRRPKHIPIETKNEPLNATYPDVSLSPNKDTKTKHLNIKLNKLQIQSKTRSVDEETETKTGTDTNSKSGLKRSISAKTRNNKIAQSEFLPSPTCEEAPAANQNAAFGLKPSHPPEPHIPHGNHRNERNARFQNISEESGIYSTGQNSTESVLSNQSEHRDPTFEHEVPTLATGSDNMNLEETLRSNAPINEMPIYENLPYGFNFSRSVHRSDLYLQEEVLKLRDTLDTIGGAGNVEQLCKDLKTQKYRIFDLELMNEKLRRDSDILKFDTHQKQQTILTQGGRISQLTEHLHQLTDQNSQLIAEIRQLQATRLTTYAPPKMPPKYTPPCDKPVYYVPSRARSDQPQMELIRNTMPRKTSQSEFADQRQFQARSPAYTPPLFNQSNHPQASSLPRSLPAHNSVQDFSNIPLNPHSNGGYPNSHDPRAIK